MSSQPLCLPRLEGSAVTAGTLALTGTELAGCRQYDVLVVHTIPKGDPSRYRYQLVVLFRVATKMVRRQGLDTQAARSPAQRGSKHGEPPAPVTLRPSGISAIAVCSSNLKLPRRVATEVLSFDVSSRQSVTSLSRERTASDAVTQLLGRELGGTGESAVRCVNSTQIDAARVEALEESLARRLLESF